MDKGKHYKILDIDPYLEPHKRDIQLRMERYYGVKQQLLGNRGSLSAFANGYLYFGFHPADGGWYYREWAPAAKEMMLVGDFNGWDRTSHRLTQVGEGVWEIFIPGENALPHASRVKVQIMDRTGQVFDRIPLYCKRVVQNPDTLAFDGQVWSPPQAFAWSDEDFRPGNTKPLLIYECHVGMAGEEERVATFREFTETVLPRVQHLGYSAIQLMAVMEHPYYGSFGYQVSNFFAVSSRFGTPEDLKELVNMAHAMGIAVLLDIVHSHAAPNALDGIGAFDGTAYQFFHDGPKGEHPAWGTKLFNYGKPEVLHFLLSNIKFWLEEYHLDGFRFDGVTSMLYHDHGLGSAFDHYNKYFSLNTDVEAITYLQLAAELSKKVRPGCVLIAEDMSGMPGMCLPIADGGIGFDYRLGMGVPDFWIKTLKEKRDEDWSMGQLWHELTQRRPKEKVVGYCESHDQALVGDKTIIFWLADQEMYWHMSRDSQSLAVDRAIALHKLIRLITATCGGEGYLNFMGNEFGHPEWIDFPREGNGWSYKYARRQWHLADDESLKYQYLEKFDEAMIHLIRENNLSVKTNWLVRIDEGSKLLIYYKGRHLFLFNFHPSKDCMVTIPVKYPGTYHLELDSRWQEFGGWRQRETEQFSARKQSRDRVLELNLEHRSAIVLKV